MNEINDENSVLKQIVQEYIKDNKRKRRWRLVYKVIFLIIILLLVVNYLTDYGQEQSLKHKAHVGLIEIRGTIFDQSDSSADNVAKSLHRAYKDKGTQAILLKINSPGGSPVQADYIYNEITRYRKKYPKIKVYAVCTDMCASAAYYAASAADYIYANPSSLVGSIGVLFDGFGFVGTMQKLGVERRLITAGKDKGFLDPFSPVSPEQQQILQKMLDSVHTQFEDKVKEGRGSRLKITPEIFSGLVWTGSQAKTLGLIDDFGSPGYVAREVIKVEDIVDYTSQNSYFEKLTKQFGVSVADGLFMKLGFTNNPVKSELYHTQ